MKKAIMIMIIIASLFSLFGCKQNKDKFISAPDNFSYYPKTKMNSNNTLYVFDNTKLNFEQKILGQAIQGLFAKKEVKYYALEGTPYLYWLNDLIDNYNIKRIDTTIDEMILDYKKEFDDIGYILYDNKNLESVNVASSLAGILNYLPVTESLVTKMNEENIPNKLDVRDKTERWLFNNYSDKFNYSSAIQLRGDIPHLRDFGIANEYIFFYQEGIESDSLKLRSEIHNKLTVDAPLFGWGPGVEESHVGIASQFGQFTIPSDYCYNTTVFTARDFYNISNVKQKNQDKEIAPQKDKHYIAFVRSDGDNAQTWYNYFPFSPKDMGAERKDFPMGWSIQPSLIDLAPTIISNVYNNADINDYFVCAVSGHGYMYPKTYKDVSTFMSRLSMYLRKTDLSVVQILDSSVSKDVIEMYAKVPEIIGGMYMYGDKYAGGKGSVYWSSNEKPFVSFRESLWDANVSDLAYRINNYKRDYTSIEGYTLINLHPWSMQYSDIYQLISLLDEDVVVVSPNNLIKMISSNVEKIDVVLE